MHTYKIVSSNLIIRMTDGASIPADPANTDYALYLHEVDNGATVIPADIPNPNVEILGKISSLESLTMVPRSVREFMMRTIEDYANRSAVSPNTPEQILAADVGYQRIKAVDDQARALRKMLK
jgi:hypothetical protein